MSFIPPERTVTTCECDRGGDISFPDAIHGEPMASFCTKAHHGTDYDKIKRNQFITFIKHFFANL